MLEIVKRFFALVGWGIACLALAVLAGWLVFVNYQALVSALELWGTEKKALGDDELIGGVITAVVPFMAEATLAHGFAAAMAAGIAGGLFFLVKFLFDVWKARDERGEYRRLGQTEQAHQLDIFIRRRVRELCLITPPLIGAIWLDMALFTYRTLNGIAGIDDPQQAVDLLYWGALPAEASEKAAVYMAVRVAPIAYISIIALISFMLEIVAGRCGETLTVLGALATSVFGRADDGDADVNADDEQIQESEDTTPTSENSPEGDLDDTGHKDHVDESGTGKQSATPDGSVRVPVIGGAPGDTISLTEAQADSSRYHVEIATRSVWTRAYWDALHQGGAS